MAYVEGRLQQESTLINNNYREHCAKFRVETLDDFLDSLEDVRYYNIRFNIDRKQHCNDGLIPKIEYRDRTHFYQKYKNTKAQRDIICLLI